MSKEERDVLKQMLYDYGNEGVLKNLALVLKELSHDQSDMGLKDQAKESSELSDILVGVRSKFCIIGRHHHAG